MNWMDWMDWIKVSGRFRAMVMAAVCGAGSMMSGCATDPNPAVAYDPHEAWNRDVYAFNDGLDKAILKPASQVYDAITPDLLQEFIYNFFDNLAYPGTILNQFLQGKVDEGVSDIGRFVFNSTLGIGGLIDVSSGFGMPRHDEDFGQTLGVWGVEEGSYFEVPLLGPFTGRDLPNIVTNRLTDIGTYIPSPESIAASAVELADQRDRLDPLVKTRDQQLDPYAFQRDGYRQRRLSLIYDGNPPLDDPDIPASDLPTE